MNFNSCFYCIDYYILHGFMSPIKKNFDLIYNNKCYNLYIYIYRGYIMSFLFERNEVSTMLKNTTALIKGEIEILTNSQILGSDLEELKEYYYDKYEIEPIELFMDSIDQDIKEIKIKQPNPFFRSYQDPYDPEFFTRDGYEVIYNIPFVGDVDLLYLKPSIYLLTRFPIRAVNSNTSEIVFSLEFEKNEFEKHKDSLGSFVENVFNTKFNSYKDMINNINNEVNNYNSGLISVISGYLDTRKRKASEYHLFREKLNIPLETNSNAPNLRPIPLKKIKKNRTFPKQRSKEIVYSISDDDYINIKNIINLACTSMEKTARTFSKLHEEELRDVILSNLNTHYRGNATGETFNRVGKSDIHIPFDNKSAYIGECKIWHGAKVFNDAIQQLFGYTTWRDTKTSLIIFNKENKDFTKILLNTDKLLKDHPQYVRSIKLGKNKWQCTFKKYEDIDDTIEIDIGVYDLYIDTEN